jgi:hypothetical protein
MHRSSAGRGRDSYSRSPQAGSCPLRITQRGELKLIQELRRLNNAPPRRKEVDSGIEVIE